MTKEEAIPYGVLKYVFLIPAAVLGGCVFARSGSWLRAIQYDFWMYLVCWALVKPVEWVGAGIARALHWLLPLWRIE